jgi:hypothetical protein
MWVRETAYHSPPELHHSPHLNQQRVTHVYFSLTWLFLALLLSSFDHSSSWWQQLELTWYDEHLKTKAPKDFCIKLPQDLNYKMILFHKDATHLDNIHISKCMKSNADIVHMSQGLKVLFMRTMTIPRTSLRM